MINRRVMEGPDKTFHHKIMFGPWWSQANVLCDVYARMTIGHPKGYGFLCKSIVGRTYFET